MIMWSSTTLTDTIWSRTARLELHITRYPDASIAISLSGGRNLPGLMLSGARAPSISIFRLDQHVGNLGALESGMAKPQRYLSVMRCTA